MALYRTLVFVPLFLPRTLLRYTLLVSLPLYRTFSVLVHGPLYPNLQRFSGDYSLPTPVLVGSSSRTRSEHIESDRGENPWTGAD